MNAARLLPLGILLSIALFPAGAANADCYGGSNGAWVFFSNANHDPYPPYFDYCTLKVEGWLDTLSVKLYSVPFQKTRITVPDPPFGSVLGETWLYPQTGDRATGLEFDMGGCTTSDTVVLGYLYVFVNFAEVNPGICQDWTVGTAEIQDCQDHWLPAAYIPQRLGGMSNYDCICQGWQFCYSLPPYDLYPPDGATDVPLNVVLSWKAPYGYECGVAFYTDPSCTSSQWYSVSCDDDSFAPGFLQPHTTYYWAASWVADAAWGCAGWSAVRSFTTGDRVNAVEHTTWGHVKALYR